MAVKSIKQSFSANQDLQQLMKTFKDMVNCCIRIGLDNNCSTLKRLSLLSYHELEQYDVLSYYKLNAISQACGRLAQMKRDIRKGMRPKSPYVRKPYLVSCYGFKINGTLLSIPVSKRNYANVLLNDHTISKLKEGKPRSFTIRENSLSICIRKEISEIKPESVIGIDRNLRNVTISTLSENIMYRTNKLLSIKENTMYVISSLKRNDHRIRKRFYQKLGNRRTRRVNQFLHKISKDIVSRAVQSKAMIVFEDLKGIRKLYRKGNGQGNKYRRKLNGWSFYELQRQVEYKARWEGIPVRYVNPRRTSMLCPICGGRLQEDRQNRRKLLCINCSKVMDRDVVASMNVAYKGWARFIHPRGDTGEAMVLEPGLITKESAIQIVDVSKGTCRK